MADPASQIATVARRLRARLGGRILPSLRELAAPDTLLLGIAVALGLALAAGLGGRWLR